MKTSEKYIDLFDVPSVRVLNKIWTVSINRIETIEKGEIRFSCNCPDFIYHCSPSKERKHCRHITLVDIELLTCFPNINPWNNVKACVWNGGTQSSLVYPIKERSEGQTIEEILGFLISPKRKLLEPLQFHRPRIRMCVFCYCPQEISLDSAIFLCFNCGRKQLA